MMKDGENRGGAPVGYLSELGAIEAGAVLYLRLWCDGPNAKSGVSRDFVNSLGTASGEKAIQSLENLCDLCVRYGRRPLMRHKVTCKCLGADEAFFANFIAAASNGQREDAMMIATTFVRADIAMNMVGLAEAFGLALKRMALSVLRPTTQHSNTNTLH